jgi:hypothetical protein
MSMSRWRSIHQKGAASFVDSVVVVAITMQHRIKDCNVRKDDSCRPHSMCRQLVRKSGGSWSYVASMTFIPCSQ